MTWRVIAIGCLAATDYGHSTEDHMNRWILAAVLAAFSALTVAAVARHGYVGIFQHQLQSLAGLQVLADLGIALLLVLAWLWRDAHRTGRNPWPWIVLTLVAGSFGPLLYLLGAPRRAQLGAAPTAD
jgi:drug/metabolite transporter (DMT)-like permease